MAPPCPDGPAAGRDVSARCRQPARRRVLPRSRYWWSSGSADVIACAHRCGKRHRRDALADADGVDQTGCRAGRNVERQVRRCGTGLPCLCRTAMGTSGERVAPSAIADHGVQGARSHRPSGCRLSAPRYLVHRQFQFQPPWLSSYFGGGGIISPITKPRARMVSGSSCRPIPAPANSGQRTRRQANRLS